MKASVILLLVVFFLSEGSTIKNRYEFFRKMAVKDGVSTRRVFGGELATLREFPAVAALLDQFWNPRCSCSVIAKYWVLTAAHCIDPKVAFVQYNTRQPKPKKGYDMTGNTASVLYLYKHPKFKVVESDEGDGKDITELHHDVGLIRTRQTMTLHVQLPMDPLKAMRRYAPISMHNNEVEVLGFGNTEEKNTLGEELFAVKLQLTSCDRETWSYCVCAMGYGSSRRGVCSGDSGGPMVFNGSQIGITAMGPIQCATRSDPGPAATSVFTSLHEYADLIEDTIADTEHAMKMTRLNTGLQEEPLTLKDTYDPENEDPRNWEQDERFKRAYREMVLSAGYTPEGDLGSDPGLGYIPGPVSALIASCSMFCLLI